MIEWGICWSLDEAECTLTDALCVKADSETFAVLLTGLPCETEIFYRAYALSMAGVAYGEVKSLQTAAPSVAVLAADEPVVDETMGDEVHIFVRLGATVEDNGGAEPTSVGVCYNTTGNPTLDDEVSTTYLYGDEFAQSVALLPANHLLSAALCHQPCRYRVQRGVYLYDSRTCHSRICPSYLLCLYRRQ